MMKKKKKKEKKGKKKKKECKIFLKKKEIIKDNEEIKGILSDKERHDIDISNLYEKWAFVKTIKINSNLLDKITFDEDNEKSLKDSLKEENFIPSPSVTKFKLKFYKSFYKTFYITSMIIFILIGLIILVSESSLYFPPSPSSNRAGFMKRGFISYLIYFFIVFNLFYYTLYSTKYTTLKVMGTKYKLSPNNKTNTISILLFCGNLSDISYPLCTNIIRIMKQRNGNEKIMTVIETEGSNNIQTGLFSKFESYLSLIIFVVAILTYFRIVEIIVDKFKKKKAEIKFHNKNEATENYIKGGKDLFMKLNQELLGEIKTTE